MSPYAGWDIFTRHPANPIITADSLPYRANSVFNPGAGRVDGETLLLVRVEDLRGISHLIAARSTDGVRDWRFDASRSSRRSRTSTRRRSGAARTHA